MPYFASINLLFIHITKTGGSSVEQYLSTKYRTQLNVKSLFSTTVFFDGVPYQHLSYQTIKQHPEFGVDISPTLRILTIVRNPYDRVLSELFFCGFINKKSSLDDILQAIKLYKITPQYQYLIDEDGQYPKNLLICHTETLASDMLKYGFVGFNIRINKNKNGITDYSPYLSKEIIAYINEIHFEDFTRFGYKKID